MKMDVKMDELLLHSSPLHNPILDLSDQNKQQKITTLLKQFVLPVSKLKKIMQLFDEEMKLGLMADPPRKSVFYMCNTYVTEQPDGTEEGDFLSMDLGGSNLRLYLVRLKRGTQPEIRTQPYDIDVKYRRGTAEELFDFLSECIQDFIEKNPEVKGKHLPFGFTFSFGYSQEALDKGIMKDFSLETDLKEAVGKDAVQVFRNSIKKKGLDVDVLAIVNDTTSTLAYGMYLKPNVDIGFIMGSGTNTCYLEEVQRIKYLDPIKTFGKKVDKVIINCENGFLGDNGSIDFAKTTFDLEIDEESTFPHNYGYEKLIGGVFIGELVRRSLLDLAQNDVFLNGVITEKFRQKDSISGPDVSSVESDSTNGSVISLLERLGYTSTQITSDDISTVKYVCALISVRNALLAAVALSSVAQHIGKPLVRAAIDGSLYKKHPKMHKLISDFVAELTPNQKVEIFLADGGSGIGSALVAAVADKHKQKS